MMKFKSFLAKPFALYIHKQIKKDMGTAVQDQERIFSHIIKLASQTVFGKDHSFEKIKTPEDFAELVPIRDCQV